MTENKLIYYILDKLYEESHEEFLEKLLPKDSDFVKVDYVEALFTKLVYRVFLGKTEKKYSLESLLKNMDDFYIRNFYLQLISKYRDMTCRLPDVFKCDDNYEDDNYEYDIDNEDYCYYYDTQRAYYFRKDDIISLFESILLLFITGYDAICYENLEEVKYVFEAKYLTKKNGYFVFGEAYNYLKEHLNLDLLKKLAEFFSKLNFSIDPSQYNQLIKPYEEKILQSNDLDFITYLSCITNDLSIISRCEDVIVKSKSIDHIFNYTINERIPKSYLKIQQGVIDTNDGKELVEFFKLCKDHDKIDGNTIFDCLKKNNDLEAIKNFYKAILNDHILFHKFMIKEDGKINVENFNDMLNFYVKYGYVYECYLPCLNFVDNLRDKLIEEYKTKILKESEKSLENKEYVRDLTYYGNVCFILEEFMKSFVLNEEEFLLLKEMSIRYYYVSPSLIIDYLNKNKSGKELKKELDSYLKELKEKTTKYIYYKDAVDGKISFDQADAYYIEFMHEFNSIKKYGVKDNKTLTYTLANAE